MPGIAITGAASGIGAATRARLEAAGQTVVGVDLHDTEVIADLSTPEGRDAMIKGVTEQSGGQLDGVVACAGITSDDGAAVISVNWFGAHATLDGLRPLMGKGAAAVALSSNSTSTVPGVPDELVRACLDLDEDRARELATAAPDFTPYPASKLALAWWVRRQAVSDDWIGSGIRINAVAPGVIDTPMNEGVLDTYLSMGDIYPVPAGRAAAAEEVAGLICWMLSDEASFLVGSVLFLDGGTDAALNPEGHPRPSG